MPPPTNFRENIPKTTDTLCCRSYNASVGGVFISFEGVEGCGKTTQMRLLAQHLAATGVHPLLTREPGGTPVGEAVRELLLHPGSQLTPWAELFLLLASRAQLVRQVIEPALAAGRWVLSDRFCDSSLAYQAEGRGLPWPAVQKANHWATGGLLPHRTVLLAVPVETALQRARTRASTTAENRRFEEESLSFHRRVAGAFLRLARREPHRICVVDGLGSAEAVHRRVLQALEDLLP